jgi:predicted AAA+ superfamily ATPase
MTIIQKNNSIMNSLEEIAYQICRGGLPLATTLHGQKALEQAFDYVEDIINIDIHRVDNVRRSSLTTRRLLRSLARHQATSANLVTLCKDLKNNESQSVSDDTVAAYLDALNGIFVVEDLPAWNPNLRSKTAIRTSDTRYFIDPSIATAVLGLSPLDLINDLNTMGLLFETLVVRDLRVYADALDGQVYHYRDKSGLECDAIVHLRDGSYGMIEIKLGGDKLIEDGAISLKELRDNIDTTHMKSPSFMMVLTGVGDFPYLRDDGIFVVPIGCLKP